jgi:hypothetical protein
LDPLPLVKSVAFPVNAKCGKELKENKRSKKNISTLANAKNQLISQSEK